MICPKTSSNYLSKILHLSTTIARTTKRSAYTLGTFRLLPTGSSATTLGKFKISASLPEKRSATTLQTFKFVSSPLLKGQAEKFRKIQVLAIEHIYFKHKKFFSVIMPHHCPKDAQQQVGTSKFEAPLLLPTERSTARVGTFKFESSKQLRNF